MAKRFVIAAMLAVALSVVFSGVASAGYIDCDSWWQWNILCFLQ